MFISPFLFINKISRYLGFVRAGYFKNSI